MEEREGFHSDAAKLSICFIIIGCYYLPDRTLSYIYRVDNSPNSPYLCVGNAETKFQEVCCNFPHQIKSLPHNSLIVCLRK
ncbi:unnamed protein product [Linum tenue]|uniref:Uncharacterized protein n=1 Tax=Linum tenue TaxID=586396 RepID=A0AAV0IB88_9ROSI|nr:unnamed protein product [Linum tenue]